MSQPTVWRQEAPVVDVDPGAWREACRREIEDGGRFCGAYAAQAGGELRWRALFARGAQTRVLSTAPPGSGLDTLVDIVGAADWDEREAHEVAAVRFAGDDSRRPLLEHTEPSASWTVAVAGRGVHEVAVGPVHAGVIESGHFRFHVVGERILHLDLRLFYKRRGLERAALGRAAGDGLAYAQRACGACAVANSVAYAQACESALGLRPPRDLRRARTLLLELERLYNHLNDLAAVCAGIGFATGNMAFAALKERALRLNEELAGHRFLFGTVAVGAGGPALDAAAAQRARATLRELAADSARVWREFRFAPSAQARLDGVGMLARASASELGAVGPAARAAGLRQDTRSESPGLWYGGAFEAALPERPDGDVAARVEVRWLELQATFELLEELLAEPIASGRAEAAAATSATGVARVESPRGETVCAVEIAGGRLAGLRLRTGSFANWPVLAAACTGNLLPDFPLINKSFELCYACSDR